MLSSLFAEPSPKQKEPDEASLRSNYDSTPAQIASARNVLEELMSTIDQKSVLLQLATGNYSPRIRKVDLGSLIEARLARYRAATRLIEYSVDGEADCIISTDATLVNIILDNVLSNAFKYGDSAIGPPSVTVRREASNVAELKRGSTTVIEVRNFAGRWHEKLCAMGEVELNRIAMAEGQRAHGDYAASKSAGDGWPMAATSASILHGSIYLKILPDSVIARIELPLLEEKNASISDASVSSVPLTASADAEPACATCPSACADVKFAQVAAPIRIRSWALVDDSKVTRMRMERVFRKALHERLTCAGTETHVDLANPMEIIIAGDSFASIEHFVDNVIQMDADIVLIDQNFGEVHNKLGTDLVSELRAFEAAKGIQPRLIYIISAADTAFDTKLYTQAGADGHLPKMSTSANLLETIIRDAQSKTRFRMS